MLDELMASLGGVCVSDKDGKFWLFHAGEMEGILEPFSRKRRDVITVGIDVSVSHPNLSEVAAAILNERCETRQSFEWHQRREDILDRDDIRAGFNRVVNHELDYLKSLKIESIINTFASNCPDSPSMKQVFHLVALAVKGEVYQLTDYLDAVKRGKRRNFVPMVDQKMLERALNVAMQRLANE